MVDHLTSWPIATAIPDKEAITVANAIPQGLNSPTWSPRNYFI